MIVMKFGGSSLASAASIGRVVSIIRSEAHHQPVVIASAMGDTTDSLLDVLSGARRANSYSAWKLQESIRNQHFGLCQDLLYDQRHAAEQFLQQVFRDLHVRMLELSEGERRFSRELQDWTVSLGEQISSRLLAAVLEEHYGATKHLDARKLILTDSNFTNAQPCYPETYARIRWSVPSAGRENLVVLGGFIGSTEDGRTTTLGRGGSDLTASIVGAAIQADEIQVWKDVDGMLTCDPRLLPGAHQVKRLSYEEASELAGAGANILHPETMAPAKLFHIPVTIRNTFCPSQEGTRIEAGTADGAKLVKSIAVTKDVSLLEISSPTRTEDDLQAMVKFCREHSPAASVLCSSEHSVFVTLDPNAKIPEDSLGPERCLQVRLRCRQAILTLVGQGIRKDVIAQQLSAALQGTAAFIVPTDESSCSVRLAVPQEELMKCLALVHWTFFSNPDPAFFIPANGNAERTRMNLAGDSATERSKEPATFVLHTALLQPN